MCVFGGGLKDVVDWFVWVWRKNLFGVVFVGDIWGPQVFFSLLPIVFFFFRYPFLTQSHLRDGVWGISFFLLGILRVLGEVRAPRRGFPCFFLVCFCLRVSYGSYPVVSYFFDICMYLFKGFTRFSQGVLKFFFCFSLFLVCVFGGGLKDVVDWFVWVWRKNLFGVVFVGDIWGPQFFFPFCQ